MRNETKSSSPRPAAASAVASRPNRPVPVRSRTAPKHRAPENAFTPAFLLAAARLAEAPSSGPPVLASGAFWTGPWEVERVETPHGGLWAVVRRGEPMSEGGRAVAVTRHRADAVVIAAILPVLGTPNHLCLGETSKRLGHPLHDGDRCLGHLSRDVPDLLPALQAARHLLSHPESLALALQALDGESLPILGRALMRQAEIF